MKFDPRSLVEVVLALITVVGAVFGSPVLLSKARLIRERDDALRYAALLEKRLTALGAGANGVDSIVERLAHEVSDLRCEVVKTRGNQALSTVFIVDLVMHIKKRGSVATMPAPPPELIEDVSAGIRARENVQTAATQGAAGVVVVPQGASE